MKQERQRWTRELSGYHWFVFLVASAAWFFDCLDQRLFSLARNPALRDLMPPTGDAQSLGKAVTALFLIGWGVGGLVFGPLGDRYGRSKMLTFAVLIYSACTGLTFFSGSYWDFALFRFLTGLGVGGVFGLAVALIAESLPDSAGPALWECSKFFPQLATCLRPGSNFSSTTRSIRAQLRRATAGAACFWSVRYRPCSSCSRCAISASRSRG